MVTNVIKVMTTTSTYVVEMERQCRDYWLVEGKGISVKS